MVIVLIIATLNNLYEIDTGLLQNGFPTIRRVSLFFHCTPNMNAVKDPNLSYYRMQ